MEPTNRVYILTTAEAFGPDVTDDQAKQFTQRLVDAVEEHFPKAEIITTNNPFLKSGEESAAQVWLDANWCEVLNQRTEDDS